MGGDDGRHRRLVRPVARLDVGQPPQRRLNGRIKRALIRRAHDAAEGL